MEAGQLQEDVKIKVTSTVIDGQPGSLTDVLNVVPVGEERVIFQVSDLQIKFCNTHL